MRLCGSAHSRGNIPPEALVEATADHRLEVGSIARLHVWCPVDNHQRVGMSDATKPLITSDRTPPYWHCLASAHSTSSASGIEGLEEFEARFVRHDRA